MDFFDKRRPSLFFHSARLKVDSKTNKRLWRMNFAVTLEVEDVLACDEAIKRAYEQLDTRERKTTRLELGEEDELEMNIRFFALPLENRPKNEKGLIRIVGVKLEALGMTRVKSLIELWFSIETELTENLHAWIGKYYATRMFAEFEGSQISLGEKI